MTAEPTCTKEGVKTFICNVCEATRTETIPMKAHTWNEEPIIDEEPTYTQPGSQSIHCSVCDGIKEGTEEDIPVKEWTPDIILPVSLEVIEEEAFFGANFVTVEISANTKKIKPKAFANCEKLKYVYIPEATVEIAKDAFDGGVIILGVAGSYAEIYAAENGYGFEVLMVG